MRIDAAELFTPKCLSRRFAFALIALLASSLTASNADADDSVVDAFRATYAAQFRGMDGGNLIFTFQPAAEPGQYIYETTADPSFLASLVVSRSARERSTLAIDAQGVRPLEWVFDDGRSSDKADGSLKFD